MQDRTKRVNRLALKCHPDKIPQQKFGKFVTQLPGFQDLPILGHQVHQLLRCLSNTTFAHAARVNTPALHAITRHFSSRHAVQRIQQLE